MTDKKKTKENGIPAEIAAATTTAAYIYYYYIDTNNYNINNRSSLFPSDARECKREMSVV
jgi:hypothetical protein